MRRLVEAPSPDNEVVLMRNPYPKPLAFFLGALGVASVVACGPAPGGGAAMGSGGSAMGTGGEATASGGSATGPGGAATGSGGSATGTGGAATGSGGSAIGTGGAATGTGGSDTGTGGAGGRGIGGSAVGGAGGRGGASAVGGRSGGQAGAGGATTGGRGGASAGGATGTGGSTGVGGAGTPVPSAGCGKTRTLQNGTRTITSGGSRTYYLRVPDNYDNNHPYRLIVAYHWLDGNAGLVVNGNNWATDTPFYGLWNLAAGSTIFVAPEGLNAGWANSGGQDVTLTDAILAQVEAELCIDTSRIFANGFSYGAGMSFAIACARPNVFRGVALYAGAQLSGCSGGTTPIAFFGAHGSADATLNISGGRNLKEKYRMLNGCTTTSTAVAPTSHCVAYQGCSVGHPATWCEFNGPHNPSPKDSGQTTSWVPQAVWTFFTQF